MQPTNPQAQHPAPSNLQPQPQAQLQPVPLPLAQPKSQPAAAPVAQPAAVAVVPTVVDVKAAPWYQQPQYGWLIHIATVVGSTALAALIQAALNSLNGAATCNPSLAATAGAAAAAQCAPAFNPATLTLLNAAGNALVSYIRNQGTIISVPTSAGGN